MRYILLIVGLIIGYLIGSFLPIKGFLPDKSSIEGNAELKVTVLRPDKSPATNLEVDIATEAGAPQKGGIQKTDAKGIATFRVKPGQYFIFFNAINFPKDLLYKGDISVTLEEGKTITQTIQLLPAGSN